MKIIKVRDYDEMSKKAAEYFLAQIRAKSDSVLGLATGTTMLGLYEVLIDMCKRGEIDFTSVSTFNIDEYVGLGADNDRSFRFFMNTEFFSNINISPVNTYLPDGMAENLEEECVRYNTLIERFGGADIQLLGLGSNGHIGFNEPSDHFPAKTHIAQLDDDTINANSKFFDSVDDVPRRAITIGIGNIMQAKKIVMCVSGSNKASVLRSVLHGHITPKVPASVLQFHRDCTIIADIDALSESKEICD